MPRYAKWTGAIESNEWENEIISVGNKFEVLENDPNNYPPGSIKVKSAVNTGGYWIFTAGRFEFLCDDIVLPEELFRIEE